MMTHDFDLVRFYLEKDEVDSIFSTGSNISDKKFNKIKDYELASCILRSKKGVQCIITNSRHCSFGYDQRVELFGSKGMLISGNKKENETETFTKNNTSQQTPLLNFLLIGMLMHTSFNWMNWLDIQLKKTNPYPVLRMEEELLSLLTLHQALWNKKNKLN